MKSLHRVTVLFVGILLLITFSCGRKDKTAEAPFQPVLEVKGIQVDMVEMQPGTFSMGCVPDGRKLTGTEEIHQAVIPGYAIMAQPVSPELWKAVTGKDGKISYDEAVKFAAKVAKWTGLPVQVAWEDQWEYAVRKGWQGEGGIRPVKGIRELTSLWGDEKIGAVVRTESERAPIASYTKAGDISFRLTWNTGKPLPPEIYSTFVVNKPPVREAIDYQAMKPGETFTVNGVSFRMVAIEGGAYTMGATPSQTAFDYAKEDEKPAHDVWPVAGRHGEPALWEQSPHAGNTGGECVVVRGPGIHPEAECLDRQEIPSSRRGGVGVCRKGWKEGRRPSLCRLYGAGRGSRLYAQWQ